MRIDPMDEWCSNCDRVGHSEPQCPYEECSDCDGEGEITLDDDVIARVVDCPECNGKGWIRR